MNFFRRLSPAFWRSDSSIHPIEVEEPPNAAEDVDCPICERPVEDTDANSCHFCGRRFDSDACLEVHSRMVHQAEQPPTGKTPRGSLN